MLQHNRSKSFGDCWIRGCVKTIQILCRWGPEHLRIWVPQGVLELISHRYSGDYSCVISFNYVYVLWELVAILFWLWRLTMSLPSTQIWTSWLLHALYTAEVLNHGVLLKLIYTHPLDETSLLLLSMSHKGTKCETHPGPSWLIFICVVCDVHSTPWGHISKTASLGLFSEVFWVCLLLFCIHAFLILLISSRIDRHLDAILYFKELWCLESIWSIYHIFVYKKLIS